MDKRANLRQYFQQEESQAEETKQYQERTAQLDDFESTVVEGFNALIKFIQGNTTKTEVVNQLKSISTPDVDKVVQALSKLDKDILTNKIDLKPVTDGLNGLKRELSLIPKSHPKQVEQREDVKVTNLSEIKLDTSAVEKAIKGLKLVAEAPIINEKEVDLKPLQNVMTDLLKAFNNQKPVVIPEFPKIPETNLTKVETKLDKSNKLLKEIVDKPVGGGGGGGNGSPYTDSTGKTMNVVLEADGSIPVTIVAGGGGSSTTNYSTRIKEDSGNADITYIGNAALGASESDPVWQIKQLYSATGLDKTWCDGNDNFDNIWTNRESLSYS